MKNKQILSSILCVACASMAYAQHADVSPRVSGGQIVTDAFEDATQTLTPNVRVFGYDFQEDLLDPYFVTDPGFNAFAGSGLPAGSQLRFNVVDGALFALPGNVSYWNGLGGAAFSAVPTGETLRLNLGAQNRTVGAATGEIAGFTIGNVDVDGVIHRHLNSFLQGSDGNSDPNDGVIPADGIYLLAMELTSSDSGIADSLPMFVVFNNGVSEKSHDEAIELVQSFVPEPGSLTAFAVATLGLLKRRQRQMA